MKISWLPVSLVLLMLVTLSAASQTSPANAYQVTVSYPGLEKADVTLTFSQPTRLSDVIQRALKGLDVEHLNAIRWDQAKITTPQLQSQLEKKRQAVLQQLRQLQDYWNNHQQFAMVNGIQRLADDIQRWKLQSSYLLAIEPDRLRVDLSNNVLLSNALAAHYQLVIPAVEFKSRALGLAADEPAANTQYHWYISATGDIAKVPVGYYNRTQAGDCYAINPSHPLTSVEQGACVIDLQNVQAHRLVGLSHQALTGRFENLNKSIAELAVFLTRYSND